MLKNLLKYEFRATARTYGGIYLALLAAAGRSQTALEISLEPTSWSRCPEPCL